MTIDHLPRTFTWTANTVDGTLHLAFSGDLDIAVANHCRYGLTDPLSGPERNTVLDLSRLTFIDSTGLRLLIDLKRTREAKGGKLILSSVSQPARRLFDLTGMTTWFDYVDGHSPDVSYCPVCDATLCTTATRCAHCGSAL